MQKGTLQIVITKSRPERAQSGQGGRPGISQVIGEPRRESEIRKSRGLGRSPQRATGEFAPPGLSDGIRECSRIAGRRFSGDLQLALRLTDFARGVARVSLASRFAVPRTLFASLRAILDASRPAIGCATDTALIRNVSFAGTECRRRLLQTCSLESIAKS